MENAATATYSLSRWTARFRDAEMEGRYEHHVASQRRRRNLVNYTVGGVMLAVFWQRASAEFNPNLPLRDKAFIVHGPYVINYLTGALAFLVAILLKPPWVSRLSAVSLFLFITFSTYFIHVPFIAYQSNPRLKPLAGPGEAAVTWIILRAVNCEWIHKAVVVVVYILGVRTLLTAAWHTDDFVGGGYQVAVQLIFTVIVTLLNDDRRRAIQEKEDFALLYQNKQRKILEKLGTGNAAQAKRVAVLRTEMLRKQSGAHIVEDGENLKEGEGGKNLAPDEDFEDGAQGSLFEGSRWRYIFVVDTFRAGRSNHGRSNEQEDSPTRWKWIQETVRAGLLSTKRIILHFYAQRFPAAEWEVKYITFSSDVSQRQQQFLFLSTAVSSVIAACGEYYLTRTVTVWFLHLCVTVPVGCILAAGVKQLAAFGPKHPKREQISCILLGGSLELGLAWMVVNAWRRWINHRAEGGDLAALGASVTSVLLLHVNFILSRGTLTGLRGPYAMTFSAVESAIAFGAFFGTRERYLVQIYMSSILMTTALVSHGESELRQHFIVNRALNPNGPAANPPGVSFSFKDLACARDASTPAGPVSRRNLRPLASSAIQPPPAKWTASGRQLPDASPVVNIERLEDGAEASPENVCRPDVWARDDIRPKKGEELVRYLVQEKKELSGNAPPYLLPAKYLPDVDVDGPRDPEPLLFASLLHNRPTGHILEVTEPDPTGATARYWLLWPGIMIMVAAPFTELFWNWRTMVAGFKGLYFQLLRRSSTSSRSIDEDAEEDPAGPDEQPQAWMWVGGLLASIIMTVIVGSTMFGVGVGEGILAVILAFIFAFIGIQASGTTDINPTGVIAKTAQIVYGGITRAKGMTESPLVESALMQNLMAGALASAAASQAVEMVGDLKTGHLLRASPKTQFISGSGDGSWACASLRGIVVGYGCAEDFPTFVQECATDQCVDTSLLVFSWCVDVVVVISPLPRDINVFLHRPRPTPAPSSQTHITSKPRTAMRTHIPGPITTLSELSLAAAGTA
ncbi:OPT oligopeptide transporter protein-domain-containing protein [Fimicolochytrium jonesii]|uniref:OPT oligopeptide transporter protein-domain-containing protein n=1 Tax=Fimicolochytrium jonesii TaxID=1396493 RepID=UPI0022FDF04A|nr:OPT oligopeptide transporter protein-domain-containing protein [Fimicolochytrium jonesii]KAI8817494.1 OPT oligopeptide transporter protein-domain-containing protein [Fimicolochytrium jonesii]